MAVDWRRRYSFLLGLRCEIYWHISCCCCGLYIRRRSTDEAWSLSTPGTTQTTIESTFLSLAAPFPAGCGFDGFRVGGWREETNRQIQKKEEEKSSFIMGIEKNRRPVQAVFSLLSEIRVLCMTRSIVSISDWSKNSQNSNDRWRSCILSSTSCRHHYQHQHEEEPLVSSRPWPTSTGESSWKEKQTGVVTHTLDTAS